MCKELFTGIDDRTDIFVSKIQEFNIWKVSWFWKHEDIYVQCITLRRTVALLPVAIQAIHLSIQAEHLMGHHVPIFELVGGGLFLLLSNFSVGDIRSHVILQYFYISETTITTQKKHTNGLSAFHGPDLPLIYGPLTSFSFWASESAALNTSWFDHLYYTVCSSQ